MKKFLALFMVCAFAFAASAATTYQTLVFSRKQFQPSQFSNPTNAQKWILTVPLIYKGTVSWKAELQKTVAPATATTNTDCLLTKKGSKTIYLTMCQPCIDCYPCQDIYMEVRNVPAPMAQWGTTAQTSTADAVGERITKMNLYFIDTHENNKVVEIFKVNMNNEGNVLPPGAAPGATPVAMFYSGSNKSGSMIVSRLGWFQGKRNNYTFKYNEALVYEDPVGSGTYKWSDAAAAKSTAYIKSLASITGTSYTTLPGPIVDGNDTYSSVQLTATYKLSRNSSLTNTAVKETFSGTITTTGSNGWEDCSVNTPARFCEEYFVANNWDVVADKFDKYLATKLYKAYYEGTGDKALQVNDAVATVDGKTEPTNHNATGKWAKTGELTVDAVLADLLF